MADDSDVRVGMYETLKNELYERQLSNSESFDKSILSLSSAGLVISISFIKDIVPIELASGLLYLKMSWVLFCAAIISTILSLMSSQLGIDKQLTIAREYYIEKNDDAISKKNIYSKITNWLNWSSGTAFVCSILLMVIFAMFNI